MSAPSKDAKHPHDPRRSGILETNGRRAQKVDFIAWARGQLDQGRGTFSRPKDTELERMKSDCVSEDNTIMSKVTGCVSKDEGSEGARGCGTYLLDVPKLLLKVGEAVVGIRRNDCRQGW